MSTTKKTLLMILYYSGILALSRLIPHPPNFTPIIAMAVFMPYMIRDVYVAMLIPLMAMFISDLYLGMHSSMFWVYGSIMLCTLLSASTLKQKSLKHLASVSVGSSVMFYVITNFAVWLTSTMYPKTLEGLVMCYTMAIPFFQNTFVCTILYVSVLFLIYETAKRSYSWLKRQYL